MTAPTIPHGSTPITPTTPTATPPMSAPVKGTQATAPDAAISTMEAELTKWGKQLDDLFAKAKSAGKDVKVESHKQLEDLKAKVNDAMSKLRVAKHAGGDKWTMFKRDIEHSWKDLEAAFQKLAP